MSYVTSDKILLGQSCSTDNTTRCIVASDATEVLTSLTDITQIYLYSFVTTD